MSKSADLYAVTRQSVYGHKRGSEVCATEFIMVMASDYDALQQHLTATEQLLRETSDYLDGSIRNAVWCDSILHKKMKAALKT